jgi:hypothetical protein
LAPNNLIRPSSGSKQHYISEREKEQTGWRKTPGEEAESNHNIIIIVIIIIINTLRVFMGFIWIIGIILSLFRAEIPPGGQGMSRRGRPEERKVFQMLSKMDVEFTLCWREKFSTTRKVKDFNSDYKYLEFFTKRLCIVD